MERDEKTVIPDGARNQDGAQWVVVGASVLNHVRCIYAGYDSSITWKNLALN
jgi:hypothetical protein